MDQQGVTKTLIVGPSGVAWTPIHHLPDSLVIPYPSTLPGDELGPPPLPCLLLPLSAVVFSHWDVLFRPAVQVLELQQPPSRHTCQAQAF